MRALLAALCLCAAATIVFAQADRGTITGIVTDPAGAVVPGAAIEAKNTDTGAIFPVRSSSTGNYTIGSLPAGLYEITVKVTGFKTFTRKNLRVEVSQTLPVDIPLEVGSSGESVTVTTEAPLLKTESTDVSHNVNIDTLDNLPIFGIGGSLSSGMGIRNPFGIAQVLPGTVFNQLVTMVVNGLPNNSASYKIDGQDASNGIYSFAEVQEQPGVDAIEEVSVLTSNFAPEFGTVGGGLFNFTMRGGTNTYHGSLYDNFVNEVFNAGLPFTNDPAHPGNHIRPETRRNDYGFTLGGPVKIPKLYDGHNKTFFFFNFEQYRENLVVSGATVTQTVPTPAMRDGDFSAALNSLGAPLALSNSQLNGVDQLGRGLFANEIYDPASEFTQTINGQPLVFRNPFPNNVIPATRFDPVAVKIQNLIPLPNSGPATQLVNNYFNPESTYKDTTIPSFKLDQNIGAKGKVSFYWATTGTVSPLSGGLATDGLPAVISDTRGTYTNNTTMRLNYDHTLTPALLLHLGAGWYQTRFVDNSLELNFNPEQDLGLSGAQVNRNFPIFASMVGGNSSGGMVGMGPSAGQAHYFEQKPTYNASLTWVRGNHTYKGGMEFRTDSFDEYPYGLTSTSSTAGDYTINAGPTALPSLIGQTFTQGGTGLPYASFLLGEVTSATLEAPAAYRFGQYQFAMFIQDTWKVSRKLTVDYGVRWDVGNYPHEQYGRDSDFSFTTPNPSANNFPGAIVFASKCGCSWAPTYPYGIGPRLGVAYQINSKTVFRSGWGLVYEPIPTGFGRSSAIAGLYTTASVAGFDEPAFTLSQGYPTSLYPQFPSYNPGFYPAPGTNSPSPIYVDPNAARPGRINQWSVGLQRQITRNMVAEGSYVGNRAVWLPASFSPINYVTPQSLAALGLNITNTADDTLLTTQIAQLSAAQRARGFGNLPYASFPTSATVRQSLLQFPQFNPTVSGAAQGNSWYDALQAKLTNRFSHGFTLSGVFTWSKNLILTSPINDTFNRDLSKELATTDQPLVTSISATYQVPRPNLSRWAAFALRDWTFGTFLQYGSGFPLGQPGPSTNPSMTTILGRGTTADRVSGVDPFNMNINCGCFDPNKVFVLNPAAWANPGVGQWGTAAGDYSDYRGFRHPQENVNLGRTFHIKEKYSFNIRMEFQNIFNRTELNNPTTTGFASPQLFNSQGLPTGFGAINTVNGATFIPPRQGYVVGRFQF